MVGVGVSSDVDVEFSGCWSVVQVVCMGKGMLDCVAMSEWSQLYFSSNAKWLPLVLQPLSILLYQTYRLGRQSGCLGSLWALAQAPLCRWHEYNYLHGGWFASHSHLSIGMVAMIAKKGLLSTVSVLLASVVLTMQVKPTQLRASSQRVDERRSPFIADNVT